MKKKEGIKKIKNKKNSNYESVQDWIPIEKIFNNGIIKLKNKKYLKLIKISPINFNLKSNLEKESILNSYKIFLKTCDFNVQILIQSCKQNLEKNINKIKENIKTENKEFLENISKDYIRFINEINSIKSSSSKNFYIVIQNSEKTINSSEEIIFEELNEMYFKIKECLSRCGNIVKDFDNKKEILKIICSFFNSRIYFKKLDNSENIKN